ncbi:uncharacterized protein KY384_009112 [Bacidia gigantensis]|uniref:uncharacterized protein n=1 Tax=Bacidia gigantensis TaxID=2732470 RepID=UPI001D04926E|nr:uncharacterized protein KY384_009112 [Bacidia gigantensis]KAG8525468.1 hypothetical protein KY384_009112 [Bacidia gigantensis]
MASIAITETISTAEVTSPDFADIKRKFDMTLEKTMVSQSVGMFDPQKHIDFKPPSKCYTMNDIKLRDSPLSGFAVSEPFQLFTPEAVKRMRAEIFSPEVMENFSYASNLAECQLRGYAASAAPFIYDTWKHPDTLAIISKIAGIELVPEMDFEIAHINLSSKSEAQKAEELATVRERQLTEEDEGIAGCPWEDDKPIVGWHTDSYPFVCVTMLSDCTDMVGGETALRTGDGEMRKVRGPDQGCAVILQGRYIEHAALRCFGQTERITSVTSFRPKHPSYPDDSVLTTVRPISDLSELYFQFSEYRLEMLEERLRDQLKILRDNQRGKKKFQTSAMKTFLKEQELFLAHMNEQLLPDEQVTKGHIHQDIDQNEEQFKRRKLSESK